jgi:hypothetical protein
MRTESLNSFEAIADTLRPDDYYALILLAENNRQATYEKALEILQKLGFEGADHTLLREEYPAIVLIRLPAAHLREAVLKLTENGFTKLKGISPTRKK